MAVTWVATAAGAQPATARSCCSAALSALSGPALGTIWLSALLSARIDRIDRLDQLVDGRQAAADIVLQVLEALFYALLRRCRGTSSTACTPPLLILPTRS